MQGKITAAGYVRVSTDAQAEEGLSLGEQERRIRAHAEAQNWTLDEVYVDRGVSGGIAFADRPAGGKAMAAIEHLDRLIVVKLDRLGRSAPDLLSVIQRFTSHRLRGRLGGRSHRHLDAHGRLLRTVLAGISEFERDRISERTAEAAVALVRQGRYNGPRPCGYRFVDGLFEPVESERVVVERIYREFVTGRTRRAITAGLNADNVPTVRGGLWREATVTGVLRNPVYVGKVRSRGRSTMACTPRFSTPISGRRRKTSWRLRRSAPAGDEAGRLPAGTCLGAGCCGAVNAGRRWSPGRTVATRGPRRRTTSATAA